MSLWVPRGSGLVERFTPPELSLEAVVERSWRRREGGRLLEPRPREFLRTYGLQWWEIPAKASPGEWRRGVEDGADPRVL